jgi:hypothetical protein
MLLLLLIRTLRPNAGPMLANGVSLLSTTGNVCSSSDGSGGSWHGRRQLSSPVLHL